MYIYDHLITQYAAHAESAIIPDEPFFVHAMVGIHGRCVGGQCLQTSSQDETERDVYNMRK